MALCPSCAKPLRTIPQREGVFDFCPTCNGRALTIPQLRRVAGDHFAIRLIRFLKSSTQPGTLLCPFCSEHFISIKLEDPALTLEGCRRCSVVWFDARQYQVLPEWTVNNSNSVTSEALEINALRRLKEAQERQRAELEAEKKKRSLRHALSELRDQEKNL